MSYRLKSCPFCGEEADIDTDHYRVNAFTGKKESVISVYCCCCGAEMSSSRQDVPDITPEQCVEMWNTRVSSLIVGPGILSSEGGK